MSNLVRQQQQLTPQSVFEAFPIQYRDAEMWAIVQSNAHNQRELMRLLEVAGNAYQQLRQDVDSLETRVSALERRDPQLPNVPQQSYQQWQQPGLYIGGDVHYHVDNSRYTTNTRTTRNSGGEGFWQAIAILYCGLCLLVVIANSATNRATYQLNQAPQEMRQ